MSDRGPVYVEALSLMWANPPSWWFQISLGDEVIHSDGWYDDCESALKSGRDWAKAKGYEVLPIRAEDGNEEE